ncbi:hypothetical protein [Clostridium ganghwense]|uniref:DUF8042 domain-containing protein n=1 Tax=Clostridium ganghwense TaxID=312089 RepID=A0ABT4CN89_9CLOT|nr:hypothetical protein [Clostridium ganghwense]MCY6370413.1 hypothetical protein [Clostridium ganghwense]
METIKKEELLKTAEEYLEKLIEKIKYSVELLQSGKEGLVFEYTTDIIEGLIGVIDAITLTKDIQKNIIDTSAINEHLIEINGCFESKDYILLSDLLEYEIVPILDEWRTKITENLKID